MWQSSIKTDLLIQQILIDHQMNASHWATCWQYSSNKTGQNRCSHGDFSLVKDSLELSHTTLNNSTSYNKCYEVKIVWETWLRAWIPEPYCLGLNHSSAIILRRSLNFSMLQLLIYEIRLYI